jgi:hypothetical protein
MVLPEPAIKLPLFPVSRPETPRRGIDPIGCGAIALAGLAGWCALIFVLTFLVIPFALLGVITGLVGLAVGLLTEPPRYWLASAGCFANVALLFAALFVPSLLGPTYQLSREKLEPEVFVPRVIPLPGKTLAAGEQAPEWADATRFSVMVKSARIQVITAEVRPLEIATTPKRKLTKENYLVLRLRIHQPAGGAEFASDGWGEGGTAQERRQPTLTDEGGKTYQPAPTTVAAEAGALTKRSMDFPLGITDDVYLFEAPGPDVSALHLEIPATSWGGSGTVRFTIPRTMLQVAPTKQPN